MTEELSAGRITYAFYQYSSLITLSALWVVAQLLVDIPFLAGLCLLPPVLGLGFALSIPAKRFKRVALVDSCLVISDAKRAVHVPLGVVEKVSQSWRHSPPTIVIKLREPCAFGRKILFIPADPGRFPPWLGNAMVTRLRTLSERAPATCEHAVRVS